MNGILNCKNRGLTPIFQANSWIEVRGQEAAELCG